MAEIPSIEFEFECRTLVATETDAIWNNTKSAK